MLKDCVVLFKVSVTGGVVKLKPSDELLLRLRFSGTVGIGVLWRDVCWVFAVLIVSGVVVTMGPTVVVFVSESISYFRGGALNSGNPVKFVSRRKEGSSML